MEKTLSQQDQEKIAFDMLKEKNIHFKFLQLVQKQEYEEAQKIAKEILKKEPDNKIIRKFYEFLQEAGDELPYLDDVYYAKDSDSEAEQNSDEDEWEYYEEGEWEEEIKKKKLKKQQQKQNQNPKEDEEEKEESEYEEYEYTDGEDEDDDEYEYEYVTDDDEEDNGSLTTGIQTSVRSK